MLKMSTEKDILIVEPFNGGSHGQLIKLLQSDHEIGQRSILVSLPAKKWHWRARTSALYFSQTIPYSSRYRVVFTSSVLNLTELIALRPDLAQLRKIVYFHENQLVYPVRKMKERDFQYGYNQILTSLVADVVVFNSAFNMESFLSSISSHLKLIPDHRPKNLEAVVRPKCRVLYFPVTINQISADDTHSVDTTNIDIHSIDTTNIDLHSVDTTNMDIHSVGTTNMDIHSFDTTNRDINSAEMTSRSIHSVNTTNTDIISVHNSDRSIEFTDTTNREIHSVVATSRDINFVDTNSTTYIHEENDKSPEWSTVSHVDRMFNKVLSGHMQERPENGTSYSDDRSHKLQDSLETGNSARNYSVGNTNTDSNFVKDPHLQSDNRIIGPFKEKDCLHIVWPHRWEHDKDPESFFKALLQLQTEGFDCVVSVIGETFTDVPEIFDLVKPQLADKILAWGYQTRQDYLRILKSAHVVVSTALHEFFGVAMLEAIGHGCYPLCPKRLVYPEIYPDECLYATQSQLVKRLKRFCQRPSLAKTDKFKVLVEKFSWQNLRSEYRKLLLE